MYLYEKFLSVVRFPQSVQMKTADVNNFAENGIGKWIAGNGYIYFFKNDYWST